VAQTAHKEHEVHDNTNCSSTCKAIMTRCAKRPFSTSCKGKRANPPPRNRSKGGRERERARALLGRPADTWPLLRTHGLFEMRTERNRSQILIEVSGLVTLLSRQSARRSERERERESEREREREREEGGKEREFIGSAQGALLRVSGQ
jgi:hypothetical protein